MKKYFIFIRSGFNQWLPVLLVFAGSLVIYALTMAPTVTGEDSGELIAAAYGCGVAHPPGYPLWTMLAAVAVKILPFGSIAYRVNFLSGFLGSLAAAVLCRTLLRFFSINTSIAVIGAICFACGRFLWSQAVIAEVYTLHILMFCLVFHFTCAWLRSGKNIHLYIISLLVGLALTNHHLSVLLGPILLGLVIIHKPQVFTSAKVVTFCLLLLVIGLLPYIYLPWAAAGEPYMNWGNPDTWGNFMRHVLRQQYTDESMHQAHTFSRIWGHLKVQGQWHWQQYTPVAIPFILVGIIHLAHRRRKLFFLMMCFFLVHTVGLAEILNFNFQRQELFCMRVFFLPAYVITAIWMVVGTDLIGRKIRAVVPLRLVKTVLSQLPMPVLLAIILLSNYKENDMHQYYYAHDHADNILNSLPANAMLISSGDYNTFPLIYRHYVQGARPDIVIADKYGYIEYNLYRDMPGAHKRIRSTHQREETEAYLVKHSGRPVCCTIKPSLNMLPGYYSVPCGMLYRICAPEENVPAQKPTKYHYRNLTGTPSVQDYAASLILSDYYFYLAAGALREQKTEQAMEYIDRVASLSKGIKEEMNNIGTLLAEHALLHQAYEAFCKAVSLQSDYEMALKNLALVCYQLKKYDEAVACWRKITVIGRKYHDLAGKQIIKIQRLIAKFDADIKLYSERSEKHPDNAIVRNNLGTAYANRGWAKKAEKEYQKAVELDPDYSKAYRNLIKLYREQLPDPHKVQKYLKVLKYINDRGGPASQK